MPGPGAIGRAVLRHNRLQHRGRTVSLGSMLAAVATSQDPVDPLRGLELQDVPRPAAGPGWVVVRVRASSLNMHDLWTLRGEPPYLRTVVVGAKGSEDSHHDWHRAREIEEAGALLVRPDGYVAWRHASSVWDEEEAVHLLQAAIGAVLSNDA